MSENVYNALIGLLFMVKWFTLVGAYIMISVHFPDHLAFVLPLYLLLISLIKWTFMWYSIKQAERGNLIILTPTAQNNSDDVTRILVAVFLLSSAILISTEGYLPNMKQLFVVLIATPFATIFLEMVVNLFFSKRIMMNRKYFTTRYDGSRIKWNQIENLRIISNGISYFHGKGKKRKLPLTIEDAKLFYQTWDRCR